MNTVWGGPVRKSSFTCCGSGMRLQEERESKKYFCLERLYKCSACQKEKVFTESPYSSGSWDLREG